MSDTWDFLKAGKNIRCGKFRKSSIVRKISTIFASQKQMSLPGEPQGSILGGRFQFYSSLVSTRPTQWCQPCARPLFACSVHNLSHSELPGTTHLPVFRLLVTASKLSSAQRTSSSRIGIRLRPNSVREYSTFGGIPEYCRLLISPSASRPFNVSDRTFGDMSGIALAMVLKRVSVFSDRTHRINTGHLPENRDRTLRTGQESISVYFRRFSLSSNLLIFNDSYQ